MAAEVCRYQGERVVKGHDGNAVMEDGHPVTETVKGPSFDSFSFGSELNSVVDEAFVAAAVKSLQISTWEALKKAVKWLATDF